MKRLSSFAVVLGVIAPGFAAASTPKLAALPLTFEPNRGQADAEAQFVARGTGYYLTIGKEGPRMLLREGGRSASVHMRTVGGNGTSEMMPSGTLPGHSSYFRGNDPAKWIKHLPNYSQISAKNIYPGIDLVYYGNQTKLEYDFVVAPGANPDRIRLAFDGISALRLDPDGNLILVTPAGNITQHKPVIYQTVAGRKEPVEGTFQIAGKNQVRFHLGEYDPAAQLVIDPYLVYSSFLGGGNTDAGNGIATDGAANTYMTGVTYSTPDGDADILLRKISADGTAFLYSFDQGGSGDDFGNSIAIDVNTYAFVGGRTNSRDFPMVNAFQNTNTGNNNAYVFRVNQTGDDLIFSTYAGGGNDDRAYGIAVDPAGSAYLTGVATSSDFPISNNAYQKKIQGGADAFVIKFAYNGTAVYSTFLGGSSDDVANGIAVDSNGRAYLAGETSSDSFPQANAPFQRSRHGGLEGFVTELNPDGSGLVFSTFIGGSGDDTCSSISVDRFGNAYVVGSTTSGSDFAFPGKAYNSTYNGGNSDMFVAKYLPGGQSLAWTTFLGSHGTDEGNGIATDQAGNVYVVGDTDSDQYPVSWDAAQATRGGGFDAVLSVLDTNGVNLVYSTFFGGNGDESASSVAVDQYYEAYMTGYTGSNNFPVSAGAVQSSPGGGDFDSFLTKISVYSTGLPGATPAFQPSPVSALGLRGARVAAFGRLHMASQPKLFSRNVTTSRGGVKQQAFVRHGLQLERAAHKPLR